jgi:hypothetical protein
MCIHDLDYDFEKLESADNVASAQAAATTSYKDWHDIKSGAQKNLSSLLSLGRAQKEKLAIEKKPKEREALRDYYKRGEPRKIDHQTNLMGTCQICHIVISYRSSDKARKNSSTQSRTEFRSNQCCSSGPRLTCNHRNMELNIGLLCVI